jgi:hypothetical protein
VASRLHRTKIGGVAADHRLLLPPYSMNTRLVAFGTQTSIRVFKDFHDLVHGELDSGSTLAYV